MLLVSQSYLKAKTGEKLMPKNDDTAEALSDSFLSNLFDVLESFGIDITAMLLLFWVIVVLIVVFGINLYLTLIRRQERLDNGINRTTKPITKTDQDLSSNEQDESLTEACPQEILARKNLVDLAAVSGNNQDCVQWIRKVIQWLYCSPVHSALVVDELIEVWLQMLNTKSKMIMFENGIFVEFVRLYKKQSTTPQLSQVKVSDEINDNIITTLKAVCENLVFQVRVSSNLSNSAQTSTPSAIYEIVLQKFSSLLKVVCITNESLFVARFLERPETKVQIDGPNPDCEVSFSPDLVINAILNVFTSTVVDIQFGKYFDFPKFGHNLEDNKTSSSNSDTVEAAKSIERKLLVKIVKANDLGFNQQSTGHQIYSTVEIDEPAQLGKTSMVRDNIDCPVWDQHFIFNLNEKSNEILFEVFDTNKTAAEDPVEPKKDNLLGHGIVSVLELKQNPSQLQNISLTPTRNAEGTNASLEVEFLLMEHKTSSLPSINENLEAKNSIPLASSNSREYNIFKNPLFVQSSTDISISSASFSSSFEDFFENAETFIGDLDHTDPFEEPEVLFNHSKSSSFLTSFELETSGFDLSKSPSYSQSHKLPPNSVYSVQTASLENQLESQIEEKESKPALIIRSDDNGHNSEGYGTDRAQTPDDFNIETVERDVPVRPESRASRSKESRSLIRNLKKRFSFNKRSKSVDRQFYKRESPVHSGSFNDIETERARSVPGSREPSMPKEIGNGKKQESYGNLSQASARTFLHEDSVLIIECNENGDKKHYVVPNPSAKKSKWRRRGVKLHLFNDHIFTARHISSALHCQVCQKKFSRRLGKQAYQCRDCGFVCHKPCHVNTETRCVSSSIANLHLELIDSSDQYDDRKLSSVASIPSPLPEVRVTATDGIEVTKSEQLI